MSMSKQKENKWSSYGYRIIFSTASHPFEYAKLLMQIGYEPIPPRPATTLFGKPALKLPNIFQYVKHIKSVDGVSGCYRGFAPKLCGNLLSAVATQKLIEYMEFDKEENIEEEEELDNKTKFLKTIKQDILTNATSIIISQPFHVITIRIMAQFVGRENKYQGIFGSISEIYKENGLIGFFSGLIPRLLGDILSILLANTLTYVITTYVVEEKELQMYASATMSFVATAITYPFQVVSKCMAVTNSGLAAGSPKFMPHYNNWIDCWIDLSRINQLKRGSSVFVRYYTGPQIQVMGGGYPGHKLIH